MHISSHIIIIFSNRKKVVMDDTYCDLIARVPDKNDPNLYQRIVDCKKKYIQGILCHLSHVTEQAIASENVDPDSGSVTFNFMKKDWNALPQEIKEKLKLKGYQPSFELSSDRSMFMRIEFQF